MADKPIVAVMYDFDRTLCTRDMQEYSFIPSLGITEREFWDFANVLGMQQHMDSVLAYMYAMVKLSSVRVWPWSFLTVVPASTVMSLAFTFTVPVTGRTLNLAGRTLPAESLMIKSAAVLSGRSSAS